MRVRTASLLASLFLSTAASAHASLPLPVRHVCADGLEVLVVENHAAPLVTVEIGVHEGAMTEDAAYSGLAHLYEHMFFKGNAVLPDQLAYTARTRALGMDFNGGTSEELVSYYFTTTSDHLADSMVFMRDAIVSPRFDAKEFERERVVVTGEIDRNESMPSYFLWHAIEQRVFWKYPTRKDALGSRASVLSATVDKMRTIQKRYYVPNNAVLVVTGDVHADDVFKQADALYATWARAADPFVADPIPAHPPIRASEVVLVPQPVQNVEASFVWQGPSIDAIGTNDSYPADLLRRLTADAGSRFQQALVDSGLCVRAKLTYSKAHHTGEIWLKIEALPDKLDACGRGALAQIGAMRAPDYFTDEELRNAAHRVEIDRAGSRETTSGLADELSWAWAYASLDYDATYEQRIRAVTRTDLVRYLDTWIVGKPFVLGAMASQKTIDAGLTKARLERMAGIGGGP